ncbi:MAG TPA: hypothetical protein VMS98_08630 [Thermoanaerobaculia bacterium]|nr:hypothetical protein [Thermoanaerobaculia bacterium]
MANIDPIWIWIALGVVGVLVVLGLFARGARRSRSAQLRDKFGPEYDHVVRERGRGNAELELLARAEDAKGIEIRPLSAADGERYRGEWAKIETRFVERPTTAVVEAEELISEIMRAQGYPIGDFEKHTAFLSVTHPRVVEHYRAGHQAIDSNRDGRSSTEELRQAMLHFRALITELAGSGAADVVSEVAIQQEVIPSVREGSGRAGRDEDVPPSRPDSSLRSE